MRVQAMDPPCWQKPPNGRWKINWDAAIHKEAMQMGVGVIIRDEFGSVVAAQSKLFPFITDPTTADVVAASFAVLLDREVGGRQIILEGDSSVVVSALKEEGSCSRVYGQLVDDIKAVLAHFLIVEIVYVQRDLNKGAHVLAKCAISQLLDKVWIKDCPSYIQSTVLADRDIPVCVLIIISVLYQKKKLF
jgi:hypothetical protein